MRRNLWWQSLMEPAGDGGGGGGGAPAGGEGGDAAFDPGKFKAEVLLDFNKNLTSAFAKFEEKFKPKEPPTPSGDPPDAPKPGDQKPDAKYKALEKQIADLRAENDKRTEEVRREKRNSTLTTELGKLGVPAERMKAAIRVIDPDIKFTDDGQLVGDDETPLTEYLAKWIGENDMFLPPKPVGGAGAGAGQRGRGEKPPQIEDIKPGMKPEDMERIRQHDASLLGNK